MLKAGGLSVDRTQSPTPTCISSTGGSINSLDSSTSNALLSGKTSCDSLVRHDSHDSHASDDSATRFVSRTLSSTNPSLDVSLTDTDHELEDACTTVDDASLSSSRTSSVEALLNSPIALPIVSTLTLPTISTTAPAAAPAQVFSPFEKGEVEIPLDERNGEHYIAKHGTEYTFVLAVLGTFTNIFYHAVLGAAGVMAAPLVIMASEFLINALEVKRLWELEDHRRLDNNLKIAINAFNVAQIGLFAYNPLVAMISAPASFTLGVICEAMLTFIELRHARNQLDFSYWLQDQQDAIAFFDAKIVRRDKKIALNAEQLTDNAQTLTEFESLKTTQPDHYRLQAKKHAALQQAQEKLQQQQEDLIADKVRIANKRNDILLTIEARGRVFHAEHQANLYKDVWDLDAQQHNEKIITQLTRFEQNHRFNPTGFDVWLNEKIHELNNVDNFLKPTETAATSEDYCLARNNLLIDIERRCDLYRGTLAPDATFSTSVQSALDKIQNPFYIDAQKQPISPRLDLSKTTVAQASHSLNTRLKPTGSDTARAAVIAKKLSDFEQLQRERLRIKGLTVVGMTTLVLFSMGVSIACPPLMIAMAFIGIAGCYYLKKNCEKVLAVIDEKQSDVPPALRASTPMPSMSSRLMSPIRALLPCQSPAVGNAATP